MKRLFICFLCLILCFSLFPCHSSAEEAGFDNDTVYLIVFEDGSFCITTMTILNLEFSESKSTITGIKEEKFYNSNGVLQFSVSVKGTFTYNGTTATATNAKCGYTIYDSSWSFYNGFSSCSGATATATCTFSFSAGGHRTESASLTCSPSGVLS